MQGGYFSERARRGVENNVKNADLQKSLPKRCILCNRINNFKVVNTIILWAFANYILKYMQKEKKKVL